MRAVHILSVDTTIQRLQQVNLRRSHRHSLVPTVVWRSGLFHSAHKQKDWPPYSEVCEAIGLFFQECIQSSSQYWDICYYSCGSKSPSCLHILLIHVTAFLYPKNGHPKFMPQHTPLLSLSWQQHLHTHHLMVCILHFS